MERNVAIGVVSALIGTSVIVTALVYNFGDESMKTKIYSFITYPFKTGGGGPANEQDKEE
jgi:hypothetical protein